MIMFLLLQREHSFFCLMMLTVIEHHWLVCQLVVLLVEDMREIFLPITLLLLQLKLQRELPVDNVEKQNSILLPYGRVVLMAN
jgi:hypothetical protein